MPDFNRLPGKFAYAGMNIARPPDQLPPGRCSLLFNLQPDLQSGALGMRPPIAALATTPVGTPPVHSLVRLNDSVPEAQPFNAFRRYAGAGTQLFGGSGAALTLLDSGFSGNPLALVPYRPAQSPESWLYAYDSIRQRKYKTNNTDEQIGIAAPTTEPTIATLQPLYTTVWDQTTTGWSGSGNGGTVSGPGSTFRVPAGATASTVLYDSGTKGMASIIPQVGGGSLSWMVSGAVLNVGGESVVIERAFSANGYNTTVQSVVYDAPNGTCTIVPAVPLSGLERDMVVLIAGVSVRVLSVTSGPDGSYSFRANSPTLLITNGLSIIATQSFRCWLTNTHLPGTVLSETTIDFAFTPSGSGGSMTGLVSTPNLQNTNLSLVNATGTAATRPMQNEDYMHVSIAFDHPEWVTEVHVMLDVDSTTNDFAHNYYYYVLRQGDFQASVTGTGTTLVDQLDAITSNIAAQLSSDIAVDGRVPQAPYPVPESIATSAPSPSQLQLGQLAWLESIFKINDLTRVGSDASATLASVRKIGFLVYTAGGVVTMYVGGWWIGGGYGPDCNFNSYGNQAPPIQWRYRYRNSATGARSTVSPETRNGDIPRRQGRILSCPNSPDNQVDYVDWERRGGTNPDWHYVGSVPLGLPFTDNITEAAAQITDALEVACYQPWPVTDIPRAGQVRVTGTAVTWQGGDQFNVRWLRGTEIIIGGNTYSLFAPPLSATFMQLAQNVPPPSGTYSFSIPEATIEGQPLYGAWLDEANNRICTVGDLLNPGLMYFSNSDNPDGASDSGYIEITSPSEPCLNGFYAEGANYVFSSSSLYRVESTPGAANPYVSYRLSGVPGLAGAWAFDATRNMLFYWGPDGIYGYAFGAASENLTAADLYPLFPHAGQQGQQGLPGLPLSIAGQTIYPPDYSQATKLRIAYSEGFAYATYQNSNGVIEALVYSALSKGWRKDTYTPAATLFALERGVANPLLLVGAADGNVYLVSSTASADAGGPINWAVLPPVMDAGDSRASKQWGDLWFDYLSAAPINAQIIWDNLLNNGAAPVVPIAASRSDIIIDLFAPPDTDDKPVIHTNIAVLWSGTGPVFLYEWQPSFIQLPPLTTGRVTGWNGAGSLHYKFVQGVWLHANTYGLTKQLQVQYDGYQVGPPITINMNGEQAKPFSFGVPFKAHMMRLVPIDDVPWQLWDDSAWIYELEPEPANYWISQPTSLGQRGYLHAREIWLPYALTTTGAVVSVIVDGVLTTLISSLPAAPSPVKQYFACPALKGRYWQLTASGTGLQIYEKDLEFLVKSWGSTGAYERVRPFGDASGGGGISGARI